MEKKAILPLLALIERLFQKGLQRLYKGHQRTTFAQLIRREKEPYLQLERKSYICRKNNIFIEFHFPPPCYILNLKPLPEFYIDCVLDTFSFGFAFL